MVAPYKGHFKVTQIYKGQTHKGLDLVGLDDVNIYSTVTGIVERAGWDNLADHKHGMGQYVRIKEDKTNHCYYFAHLSQLSVKVGERVGKGKVIGTEGSTGHSTGSHLHYEVRRIPGNTTFLDVAKISGIPNKIGVYEVRELTEAEAKKVIREACGFEYQTMQYLDSYRYHEALLVKIAEAIRKGAEVK